ncbi:MAG: glycosyltransferase 87 family protein, partial [Promethearchaeota archaeon]
MMNLHFLDKVKKKFSELWGHKIFRYTLVLHGIFFTLSLIITLLFFPNQNDFRVYYEVGEVVLTDIRSLYTTSYNWPFRYLPVSSLYFVPFYLMGFEMGFIFFNVINLIINILISWFLYKIIILVRRDDHKKDDRRVILYICLYLISLPQVFNYILGQINLYITLLILISLYIFLIKNSLKWDLLGSIILGLSVILKPTTIF